MKTTIIGGIYQDASHSNWWHYYFGAGVSGNYRSKEQAENALKVLFDQAISQFGDKWEVTIERKDF